MATAQNLFHNLKIVFHDLDLDDPKRTRTRHDPIFRDIRDIGRTQYDAYQANIYIESRDKPWRQTTKRRADRISRLATKCRETQQNEMEWRLKIEPEVTARFDIEVTWSVWAIHSDA